MIYKAKLMCLLMYLVDEYKNRSDVCIQMQRGRLSVCSGWYRQKVWTGSM